MAEAIANELIKVVFQKLSSESLKQIARSMGIHSKLKNLEKALTNIQKLLADASDKENGDKDVKKWLNSLQHLAYDIDDILDGLETDAMQRDESGEKSVGVRNFIPDCCTNVAIRKKLSHMLDGVALKLQDLERKKATLGLIVKDEKPKTTNRRLETSLADASMMVGRQGEKEKLLRKLLEDDEACGQRFSVVPIVGMGGVGKTTLARVLYNDTQVNDHFELKVWVCVSDDFDVFKISKIIFQQVTGENREFGNLDQLQLALREKLKEKCFLLVLDDVWSEDYDAWETLVRPFYSCAVGSKIIMTTRKEILLRQLGFGHLDRLESLSHGDALSLFAYHALGVYNFDSYPTLKPLGEGIVNKCAGLPLALKALGRLLREKTDEDWYDVLNSEIWGLDDNNILPALRLSYHDLPACLKQLFEYCSLFPKGFMFDRDDLVLLWMAEGFLNQSTENMSADRLGHEYFEMLLSRSFFQIAPNDESLYVMHDQMNDLAIFVARDYFLRCDNQMEIEKGAVVKYRHMSIIREEFVGYQKFETFKKAKSLRTFLAVYVGVKKSWDSFYLSNKILVDVLPRLPLLRVLCLSCFRINELPEFIGNLKQLRYLDLSQTGITELPENVCNLYNLQTLILFGCRKLTKLPTSFLKLKHLRHFDFMDTPLIKKMPFGIGELRNLTTLTKIIIGEDNGFAITELIKLKKLQGKTCIEGLDKVKTATSVRLINFSVNWVTELELKWSNIFDGSRNEAVEKEVLKELKPNADRLKKLRIVLYGGAEFPTWVGDPLFHQLVHVSINGCRKFASLPSLAQLPSLKELYVEDMSGVKVVGLEFFGTNAVAFPSLEILRFQNMGGWEVWSTNSGVVFSCLRELCIISCPNLVEVTLETLPSLRVLEISGCRYGVLRSTVRAALSITKLNISYIAGLTDEVWRGVMMYLEKVEELTIRDCDELRYLWESDAQISKVLVNISKLEVWSCSKLVSLGEKEETEGNCGSNHLTSLRILRVDNCESMKHCICRNSIESLSIYDCSSITSVSFQNMETINEICDSVHLRQLRIQDCPSLESFPDTEFPKLTSLKDMVIRNCPSMDASFLRGNWPPRLCTLGIGGLKNPFSEWGDQNFPDSLVKLQLHGGDECTISELSRLLPQSLTSLEINGFKKLKSVKMELQHLTSLRHLKIVFCRNIINLPEKLLPSLLSLEIRRCPNLEKRITGRRSRYRSLISNIPKINID